MGPTPLPMHLSVNIGNHCLTISDSGQSFTMYTINMLVWYKFVYFDFYNASCLLYKWSQKSCLMIKRAALALLHHDISQYFFFFQSAKVNKTNQVKAEQALFHSEIDILECLFVSVVHVYVIF